MYKMRWFAVVLFVLTIICLMGCSRYLNKPWPYEDFKLKIIPQVGGNHTIDYGVVVLKYDYSFNQDRTRIILEGEVEYKEGFKLENVLLHDFQVIFFFIDSDNIVVKMENKELYKATMEEYSYPFKLAFPYSGEYDSLSCFVESFTFH